MDLAEFIAARLDDDEQRVSEWQQPGGTHWPWLEQRAMREVAAGRAILASECSPYPKHNPPMTRTMRLMAAVWSDHPDYDPAWHA